ncbi:MAG: energy-coupling factor transporter transmembrane protein EcfT [Clostridia bacterium]|nr:energy-coupling factor transporter transmembrane protein EcfT [Clostridia bacterium]
MIKDITLGQYFPGDSFLHRLDPRMKIVLSMLFIVMIFLASSLVSLLAVTVLTFLLPFVGKIPMKTVFGAIKPLRWVVLIMMVLFLFTGGGEGYHILWEFHWQFINLVISVEGILKAIAVSVRIVILVVSVSVILSYTTSPIALADGIESLLSPLKRLRVPVHDFAMMITIAMRFIPILIEETDKIMSAQTARGADFHSGSLVKRAKALIPVFIPLFVSSVRHADNLATAMECRLYRGGNNRTRMRSLCYATRDLLALFAMGLLLVGIILLTAEVTYGYLGFRYV